MPKDVLLEVESSLESLPIIRRFIEEETAKVGLTERGVSEMRLAVDEACANIIMHGYKEAMGKIVVRVDHDENDVIVALSDSAPLYNPLEETKAPDFGVSLDERAVGGMGVYLVKENTDSVEYETGKDRGNILILRKTRKYSAESKQVGHE